MTAIWKAYQIDFDINKLTDEQQEQWLKQRFYKLRFSQKSAEIKDGLKQYRQKNIKSDSLSSYSPQDGVFIRQYLQSLKYKQKQPKKSDSEEEKVQVIEQPVQVIEQLVQVIEQPVQVIEKQNISKPLELFKDHFEELAKQIKKRAKKSQ